MFHYETFFLHWASSFSCKGKKQKESPHIVCFFTDRMTMYIKSMVNSINPLDVKSVEKAPKTIKFEESHDRDANGQQSFDQKENERPPMSEEQFEKALQSLRSLGATKEHKWTVEAHQDENGRAAVIKDNLGNIIRVIPEKELWSLKDTDKDSPKGHLLKRTA